MPSCRIWPAKRICKIVVNMCIIYTWAPLVAFFGRLMLQSPWMFTISYFLPPHFLYVFEIPEHFRMISSQFLENVCRSQGRLEPRSLEASKPRSLEALSCLGGNREANTIWVPRRPHGHHELLVLHLKNE